MWMSIPSDEDGPECIAEETKPWEREDDDGLHETWYDYTRQMVGLREMVDPDSDLIKWMLERGIAPNQPFLMRFYGFRVWTSDYDGDQDEEYESELVYVEPLSDKEAADAWYEWLVLGQDTDYRETVDKICNIRPTCRGCGNEIDPDCCGCGTSKDAHGDPISEDHSFIPANCDCLRIKSH